MKAKYLERLAVEQDRLLEIANALEIYSGAFDVTGNKFMSRALKDMVDAIGDSAQEIDNILDAMGIQYSIKNEAICLECAYSNGITVDIRDSKSDIGHCTLCGTVDTVWPIVTETEEK